VVRIRCARRFVTSFSSGERNTQYPCGDPLLPGGQIITRPILGRVLRSSISNSQGKVALIDTNRKLPIHSAGKRVLRNNLWRSDLELQWWAAPTST
jgi:hypothetical protein